MSNLISSQASDSHNKFSEEDFDNNISSWVTVKSLSNFWHQRLAKIYKKITIKDHVSPRYS